MANCHTAKQFGVLNVVVQVLANGSLVLWRVGLQDRGEYTCQAGNKVSCHLSPTTCLLSPTTCHMSPDSWHLYLLLQVGDPITKTVKLKINGELVLTTWPPSSGDPFW